MTCIVGVVHEGDVFLGGDSAATDGRFGQMTRRDRKVFRNGDFVMGFTSSFRMGQLLAFEFSPPKPREGTDTMAYMVTDFIDAARARMKSGGYASIREGVEHGGTFLVGFKGRLFHVFDDFQVGESEHGFDACGSGEDVALGSLWSTRALGDPGARLTDALRAAETFNAAVRGPFHYVRSGGS